MRGFIFLVFFITILNECEEVKGQDAVETPPEDGGQDEVIEIPATTQAPVVVDCSAICEAKLADALNQLHALQMQLQTVNLTALQRIVNLETSYYNVLSDKVNLLDSDLNTKTTSLSNRLTSEVQTLGLTINSQVADMDSKLSSTKLELTTAIANLTNGKVQMLMRYNDLWKRNFRIVNNTMTKIKRRLGNNVIG